MAKIIFGDDLKSQIKSKYHIRDSKQPFSAWLVKPIKIKGKKYYLYIEQSTKLAIAAKFLDVHKFYNALYMTLADLPFTTSIQNDKVLHILDNLTYSYEKDIVDDTVEKYQKILNDISNSAFKKMKEDSSNDPETEAFALSNYLNQVAETDDGTPISTQFVLELNEVFPIPSQKPKKNVKYIDIKAKFTDPRSWENFEDLTFDFIPARQLQKNNLAIIKQFEASSYFNQDYTTNHVASALEAFLNTYLFKYGVRPVTRNLADPTIFIELNLETKNNMPHEMVNSLYDIFSSFYHFLSHAGIIRKADAEKVDRLLTDSYDQNIGVAALKEGPNSNFIQAFLDITKEKGTLNVIKSLMNGDLQAFDDEDLNKIIKAYRKDKYGLPDVELENKNRNNKTYEIRAKLKGFKPSTWRRFRISGSASVATLQKAVIAMFNGTLFGHMYDLYDNKTETIYEIPEFHDEDMSLGQTVDATKAKVSGFNLNQKFVITYDFGDNWEFEITIKKILDEKPPKHPTILSGKGYGIIEDIGGVGGLIDYYNNELDPDEMEWYGDFDLDEFDINDMNELLKGY